jgi:putative acetyltransferase
LPAIAITRVDPRQAEITALVHALDRYMRDLYPPESSHLVDVETLARPDVHFFAVTVDGTPRGCGAIMLRAEDGGYAEVKRIFVSPDARGLGLGRKIIAHLEATARAQGVGLMRLETGPYQPEALALFGASGFVTRGHFGDYPTDDPLSIFMEKRLAGTGSVLTANSV